MSGELARLHVLELVDFVRGLFVGMCPVEPSPTSVYR